MSRIWRTVLHRSHFTSALCLLCRCTVFSHCIANLRMPACRATERCTAGVMQTMYHFGKVPEDSSLPPHARALKALAEVYFFAMAWRNATAANDPGTPSLLCQHHSCVQCCSLYAVSCVQVSESSLAWFVLPVIHTRCLLHDLSLAWMYADVLQTHLLARLRPSASGTPAPSTDPLAKSLLTDAPAVYGCCTGEGSKGQLLWIDELFGRDGEGGAWRIQYNVCRVKVAGERESEMRYEAVMLPDSGAPEGFVFAIAV